MMEQVLVFGPCDELEGLECCLFETTPPVKHHSTTTKSNHHVSISKEKKRLLTRFLRRLVFIKSKLADDSSVATASTAASSTCLSSVASHDDTIPLIKQRLLDYGIEDCHFEFVKDYVSKEVIGLHEKDESEKDEENVTHVKTGIWQVTKFDDDGKAQTPFYVVTGVTMDDTVDTKKLRKVLFAGQSNKRRPKISMAETAIAEKLAGFKSGTMAPICHTTPMKLYLEESIVNDASDPAHRLNVGSGMFGRCLSIDLNKFLQVAKANEHGMELVPIKKAKRKKCV